MQQGGVFYCLSLEFQFSMFLAAEDQTKLICIFDTL